MIIEEVALMVLTTSANCQSGVLLLEAKKCSSEICVAVANCSVDGGTTSLLI
jgi:hypothetical protein